MSAQRIKQVRRYGNVTLEIVMFKGVIESATFTQQGKGPVQLDEAGLRDFSGFMGEFLYYTDKGKSKPVNNLNSF